MGLPTVYKSPEVLEAAGFSPKAMEQIRAQMSVPMPLPAGKTVPYSAISDTSSEQSISSPSASNTGLIKSILSRAKSIDTTLQDSMNLQKDQSLQANRLATENAQEKHADKVPKDGEEGDKKEKGKEGFLDKAIREGIKFAVLGAMHLIGPIVNSIKTAIQNIKDGFAVVSEKFQNIIDSIKEFFGHLGGKVKEGAKKAVAVGKQVGEGAVAVGKQAAEKVGEGATAIGKGVGEGLGKVAAFFESGGKSGTVSTGKGDAGGKSYGKFQLSSKTGDVQKFLKESGYSKQFAGMEVGSKEFDAKWKELGKTKEFGAAQQAHAAKTHYNPQVAKLQKAGIDLSGRGAGVQEAIFSTANQYGANTSVIQKALKGKDTKSMSDKEIINAIQDYKSSTVSTRFKSSDDKTRAGVAKRVEEERKVLLAVDDGPKGKPSPAETPKVAMASNDVALSQTQKPIVKKQTTQTAATGKSGTGSSPRMMAGNGKNVPPPAYHDPSSGYHMYFGTA